MAQTAQNFAIALLDDNTVIALQDGLDSGAITTKAKLFVHLGISPERMQGLLGKFNQEIKARSKKSTKQFYDVSAITGFDTLGEFLDDFEIRCK